MDFYPLLNSLRIALISSIVTFFLGIFIAYYVSKLSRVTKGVIDVILTLPLVLPPTVIGFFILKLLSPNGKLGGFFLSVFFYETYYDLVFGNICNYCSYFSFNV